jgi:uridine kinase
VSNPLVIGIAGGTGSGKTTIAQKITEVVGSAAVLLDHDAYYRDLSGLSPEERAQINFDHPDALENELLIEHILQLKQKNAIEKPIYDFSTHTRKSETTKIEPAPIVIVEGILPLAITDIRDALDIKIFVDTAADIRLIRRIRRDIEQRGRSFTSVREQYYSTVRPMHQAFVEPSKQYADLIIPEGGENRIAIELVIRSIQQHLIQIQNNNS